MNKRLLFFFYISFTLLFYSCEGRITEKNTVKPFAVKVWRQVTDTAIKKLTQTAAFSAETKHNSYPADIAYGRIGSVDKLQLDNAYDNVFHIKLSRLPEKGEVVCLRYILKGVSDYTGVARSINNGQSTGGWLVRFSNNWSAQNEYLSPAEVRRGDNVVRFNLPDSAAFNYEVKDVKLVIEKRAPEPFTLNQPNNIYCGDKAYVKGVLNVPARLFYNNQPVTIQNGEFEFFATNPAASPGTFSAQLKAILPNGRVIEDTINFNRAGTADLSFVPQKKNVTIQSVYRQAGGLKLQLNANKVKAGISIPAGALPASTPISITALRAEDLQPVGVDMVNVTAGAKAYRFLPHGTRFKKPVQIQLPVDSSLIPEGYGREDVRIFFFDELKRSWTMLQMDTAGKGNKMAYAMSMHFTDMIAGIIKVPESPQTAGYAPTAIKDYKAADPSAGIDLIAPPAATSTGSASMSFPIKIPKGRSGMQPNLMVQYNSEGGNGIMGLGWNLAIPAIDIDTRWGVPHYYTNVESETYTMGGEQLAPVANRGDFVPRVTDRIFHQRIEGAFQKIIRHGSSPTNYWWEVINKNGVSSCYGGNRDGLVSTAVLKDNAGNIARWALVETIDPHGNYVKYTYNTQYDPGVTGGVQGAQLYIDKIVYTGNKNNGAPGSYSVVFDISKKIYQRRDIEISGRLGFKMVTAAVLNSVTVNYKTQPIRTYAFDYREGEFAKTLLKDVVVKDGAGNVFYTHSFDYYDDVLQGGTKALLGASEDWSPGNDHIRGDLINPLTGFTDESSTLSTSKASSAGGNLDITFGIGSDVSKANSVGGGIGYEGGSNEGLVTMADINGDGLPDKIFKKGGTLYYRANLGLASHGFSSPRPITGISSFSNGNSRTVKTNMQALPLLAFIGREKSTTTSTTTTYFADFNGDGLVDLASDGQVYFNHLDASGNPVFELSSTKTPNPIIPAGYVDQTMFTINQAEQQANETNFPLQDAVRVWRAPFDGMVNITGNIQLVQPISGTVSSKADGVRASIELGLDPNGPPSNASNTPINDAQISAGDYNSQPLGSTNSIHVSKGQKIYFRLQSWFNGENDAVTWDPVVTYQSTDQPTPAIDANRRPSNHYMASEDFILDNRNGYLFGKKGGIAIDTPFYKGLTSDDISIVFAKIVGGNATAVSSPLVLNGNKTYKKLPKISFPVDSGDIIKCFVKSDTYIDRDSVIWLPHYYYESFADGTNPKNANNGNVIEGHMVPDNTNYNDWYANAPVFSPSTGGTTLVKADLAGSAAATGTIMFSIKDANYNVLTKQLIQLNAGVATGNTPVSLSLNPSQKYFLDYTAADRNVAMALTKTKAVITNGLITDTVKANLYTNPDQDYMGVFFRGWGQFSVKGKKEDKMLLTEAQLNTSAYQAQTQSDYKDPNNFTLPSDPETVITPDVPQFVIMTPDGNRNLWVGLDTGIYVAKATQSSSRLFMQDVLGDQVVMGATAQAANKVSSSKTISNTLSLILGGSQSTATNTTKVDMIDMNGDRYPDVVTPGTVQYTTPGGGLQSTAVANTLDPASGKGDMSGLSLGVPFPKIFGSNKTGSNATQSSENAESSFGISGSVSKSRQVGASAWIDINGDGLPDKVDSLGNVYLNLGYSFTGPEKWDIAGIDQNKSKGLSAGIGYNSAGGSWQAGFGLNRSTSTGSYILSDVNGDGLIDQVYDDGVQLNTGAGFDTKQPWSGLKDFNNNVSTGESVNLGYTFIIPIPIIITFKIVFNPSVNAGHSVSREQDQITDIDGDGFPDILHSDNDGDLHVRRSLIGRTNLLKMVHRPMGGYFTADYKRTDNTYLMPQNKWVMTSLEIGDGIANNANGVDVMRSSFSYAGGKYDRREREFYGFATVTTNQLNTAASDAVYRTVVQNYDTLNYYRKGLLRREVMMDAAGNKFTETYNGYNDVIVDNNVVFPSADTTGKRFYEGQATAGLHTSTIFKYDALGNIIKITDEGDGNPDDFTMADITYQDNDAAYIKAVPASIVVTTTAGLKRKRTTSINGFGDITQIKQYLEDGTAAMYDMEYDATLGNLTKITRPANVNGQRMFYLYAYDPIVYTYVNKVTDAYGYSSSSNYDYKFGVDTSSISMNNEPMHTRLDNFGRVTSVTGPYELASGDTTIRFEYYPNAAVPYAVTHHFDPLSMRDQVNNINTITFMDGLGRAIQVKKRVSLFAGKAKQDLLKMVGSGRIQYDAFGRTVSQYYPVTENIAGDNGTFNTTLGNINTKTTYDVMDRPLTEVLADGATTKMGYQNTNNALVTTITDALGNKHETLTDVRGRKREEHALSGPSGNITTKFTYNAISELLKTTDNAGNETSYTYDNLGRKLTATYPDAGTTAFAYDQAGNMVQKTTAQLRKDLPKGGAVNYQYEFERLIGIDYPLQYQNKVVYKYGAPANGKSAAQDDRAGRLILTEDASGGQEFYYGKLGEVTKQIRTVMVNKVFYTTYVSEQKYDTWNRLVQMTYPDSEQVNYGYNHGGTLNFIAGAKEGNAYNYVQQLGYDEYEQRVYLRYGNNTETNYNYDVQRRRLTGMKAANAAGAPMMDNTYSYDAVSNILSVANAAKPVAGTMIGAGVQNYKYDNLYRLVSAAGSYKGDESADYKLDMGYDNLYNITGKKLTRTLNGKNISGQSYENAYDYAGQVHRAATIGTSQYTYDLNGNQLTRTHTDKYITETRENFWDEDNRLQRSVVNGLQSLYTYDAGGERVIKSSGGIQANYINSSIAGVINHYDNYTVYVSPYLVCRKAGFTKHIYIESQRVVTKTGKGTFTNISFPQTAISAGGINYVARAANLQKQRVDYYISQGTVNGGLTPGPPTNKLLYEEPSYTGIQPPVLMDTTITVPKGWPGNTTPPLVGPPIFVDTIPSNENVKAGFGYINDVRIKTENDQYYYHPDHLGSTSYVSNLLGQAVQHQEYVPFGETSYDKHTNSENTPYLFNAKELDTETGLYYYGARYYDAGQSQWISTDPMVDKYPGLSPYNYTLNNPVRLVDPDGMATFESYKELNKVAAGIMSKPEYQSQCSDCPTFCNYAAQDFQHANQNHEFDGKRANDIGKYLRNPNNAVEITPDEAGQVANQGVTAWFSYENTTLTDKNGNLKSGHIAPTSPGGLHKPSKGEASVNWAKNFPDGVPDLLNVGEMGSNKKISLEKAIGGGKQPDTKIFILNSDLHKKTVTLDVKEYP